MNWRKILKLDSNEITLKLENESLKKELLRLVEENLALKEGLTNAQKQLEKLSEEVENLRITEDPLEKKFNNKYPKVNTAYAGRWMYGWDRPINIDVRNFFNEQDHRIEVLIDSLKLKNKTDDEKALECLSWIIKNIKYKPDTITTGKSEYWNFAFETLERKESDCEDGSILLANMLSISGISYWKIRITAGNVLDPFTNKKAGHCFVTYYCEDEDKWILLDWCYWAILLPIKQRKAYKDEKYYLDTWFSFNKLYCFATDTKYLSKFENKEA